jgi:hypothetical protein
VRALKVFGGLLLSVVVLGMVVGPPKAPVDTVPRPTPTIRSDQLIARGYIEPDQVVDFKPRAASKAGDGWMVVAYLYDLDGTFTVAQGLATKSVAVACAHRLYEEAMGHNHTILLATPRRPAGTCST